MARQPLLPGFTFEQTQGKNFRLNQNFNVVNGFNIPKLILGKFSDQQFDPFFNLNLEFQPYNVKNDYIKHDALQANNDKRRKTSKTIFAPPYVLHDGKCLSFQGYFKQEVPEYCREKILYRKVNVIYYLEDDTMTIIEPPVPNSGYPQGRLVRRGKIPKPNSSEPWHWKNLNVGIDIEAYGIIYHLSNCDLFTREYLLSRGIEVNANEEIPSNILHNDSNYRKCSSYYYGAHQEEMPSSQDKLHKFLQYDGKVLRFYAYWSEKDGINECGDVKRYKIYYYLIDDTIEIRESPGRFSQDELFKRLLRRTKLPKNYESGPDAKKQQGDTVLNTTLRKGFNYRGVRISFLYKLAQISNYWQHFKYRNTIALNSLSIPATFKTVDQEYYRPKDFLIGSYIHVLGRKFFIYDCDAFTRNYYKDYMKIEQPAPIIIPEKRPEPVIKKIPPHMGIGQPEDTLQSCLSIIPRPPKKDVIHYVENANKYLRYSAKLNSNIEDDKDREFIIQYSLADGKISIYEVRVPNSGFTPGYFLKSALVPKKTSAGSDYALEYYTPDDFVIGGDLVIFGRKFVITGADFAVLRHMESEPQKFSVEVVNSVREYLRRKGIVPEANDTTDNVDVQNVTSALDEVKLA